MTTTLALLAPLELAGAGTRDEVKQAIHAGLPRYDPAAYEKAQAEKAARAVPKNAPAPLPETKPAAAPSPVPVPAGQKILELPKMTVRTAVDPPKPLPRLTTPAPIDNEPGEPWESPGARDARLINNHLSKLDQFLNGFAWLRPSLTARARQAEGDQKRDRLMNRIAAVIEMQAALGLDPGEIKQLRAEFLKLYYSGPK